MIDTYSTKFEHFKGKIEKSGLLLVHLYLCRPVPSHVAPVFPIPCTCFQKYSILSPIGTLHLHHTDRTLSTHILYLVIIFL